MKIDGNELAILQDKLDREGKKQEAWQVKQEFLRQVREAGDHCPCKEACPHHGNCFECVTSTAATATTCPCACGIWSTSGWQRSAT